MHRQLIELQRHLSPAMHAPYSLAIQVGRSIKSTYLLAVPVEMAVNRLSSNSTELAVAAPLYARRGLGENPSRDSVAMFKCFQLLSVDYGDFHTREVSVKNRDGTLIAALLLTRRRVRFGIMSFQE
jgi:hypothetical protein